MKNLRKVMVLVLALLVVFSFSMFAFADDEPTTGTITITPPTGVDANATNTYKIYKVFDAVGNGTNISYTLVDGKTTAPAGFSVDSAGNVTYTGTATDGKLTAADIAAISAYVTAADLVDTVTATGSTPVSSKALPNGFYYITTSTGTVVTIDSTNPSAEVIDKNTVPSVDKKATVGDEVTLDEAGKVAVAQLGKTVPFEATITVGTGAKGYVFHDKMTAGLEYNNDVKVYIGEEEVVAANYNTATASGDTLTVAFKDEYIKTLEAGTVLVVKYSATVTSDAITVDAAKNTAYVSYGDENSNNRTPDSEVEVYDAKITVNKKDGNGDALAGAGFIISRTISDTSEGAAEGATKTVYYKLDGNVVSWVDDIAQATEHVSGDDGVVPAFTGLGVGDYTLIENTVPAGYNKAADQNFSVTTAKDGEGAYNFVLTAEVTNKAGTELPSTGGVGTTIFYILGVVLVAGCGVVLVSRKRMNNK